MMTSLLLAGKSIYFAKPFKQATEALREKKTEFENLTLILFMVLFISNNTIEIEFDSVLDEFFLVDDYTRE